MTYREAWNELVVKCQYDTGGMSITEFQKSLIVWADGWVRAAEHTLAVDGATVCRVVNHVFVDGVCAGCGVAETRPTTKA